MDHSSEIILYLCIFVVKYVGFKKKGKSVSQKKKKKKEKSMPILLLVAVI